MPSTIARMTVRIVERSPESSAPEHLVWRQKDSRVTECTVTEFQPAGAVVVSAVASPAVGNATVVLPTLNATRTMYAVGGRTLVDGDSTK